MSIEFRCSHCQKLLKLKDKCAGLTGECPYCKRVITVPEKVQTFNSDSLPLPTPGAVANTAEAVDDPDKTDFISPTKKQLDYARTLGIDIPEGISRRELSAMIDSAQDNRPATEKQKEFLRELGVKFPDDIRFTQISMLIDAAMNIRDDVSAAVRKQYDEQMKEFGQLMEHATVEQLLREIDSRGKPFVAIVLEDDEFHYHDNTPMKGRLTWNAYLSPDDAKYLLSVAAFKWANSSDLDKYREEYDGVLPEVELAIGELPSDADNVVHLSI